MKFVCLLITLIIILIYSVDGMVLFNGEQQLERLLEKSLRYKHHQQNYEISLETGVTPKGLKLKKLPALKPVSDDFYIK